MKYINEYSNYEQKLLDQGKSYYFVADLLKDLEVKYLDNFPDSIFFVNKNTGEFWMQNDKGRGHLFVSQANIWSKVERQFKSYSFSKIQKLIKTTVEALFKVRVENPTSFFYTFPIY